MFSYLIATLRYHNEPKQLDEIIKKLNSNNNFKLNLNFNFENYILIFPQF